MEAIIKILKAFTIIVGVDIVLSFCSLVVLLLKMHNIIKSENEIISVVVYLNSPLIFMTMAIFVLTSISFGFCLWLYLKETKAICSLKVYGLYELYFGVYFLLVYLKLISS